MKKAKYETFLPKLKALIEGIDDEVSVLANVSAALHTEFQWFWTGFYLVKGTQEVQSLHLGPFQGTPACYMIPLGKGVCGTAWQRKETIVVEDVEKFPGHIACSSLSQSEIVVPLKDKTGMIRAVLDVDSQMKSCFDDTDKYYLELAMNIVERAIYNKE